VAISEIVSPVGVHAKTRPRLCMVTKPMTRSIIYLLYSSTTIVIFFNVLHFKRLPRLSCIISLPV
jgi:hypothetical protein